jgi:hypothetical protein
MQRSRIIATSIVGHAFFSLVLVSHPLDYIEQAILSPKATMMTAVPSLKITIYAIRNIMYPKLAKGQIPDLLDLLATVEFYRARTLDKSQDALVWNDYYNGKGKGEEARTLTVMETGELLSLGDKKHLWRQVYVDIVGQLCKIVSNCTLFSRSSISKAADARICTFCGQQKPHP